MSERVLFVSHEASRSGAPIVLLHLLRWLRQTAGLDFDVRLLRGGPLEPEFRVVAHRCYLDWYPERAQNAIARDLLRVMRKLGLLEFFPLIQIARQHHKHPYRLIYANTCATTPAIVSLKRVLKVPVLRDCSKLTGFRIRCEQIERAVSALWKRFSLRRTIKRDQYSLYPYVECLLHGEKRQSMRIAAS